MALPTTSTYTGLKRATALLVAISFLFSNIVFADTSKVAPSEVKQQGQLTTDPFKIVIPRDYGLIKSRYAAGDSKKLVVHIQDAHCNYEAQSNIIKILECLIKNDGLSLISVEGADGFIDTSWFKAFPDADIRKEVADYFMKKGEITGPEFLSITGSYPVKLFGAETRAYYLENLNAFTSSYPLKEDTEKYFNQIKAALNKLKTVIYSNELKEFDEKSQDYEAKKITFTDYIKYLEELSGKYKLNMRQYDNLFKLVSVLVYEKKINFNVVDKERSALIDAITKKLDKGQMAGLINKSLEFKMGKITSSEYYDYLKAMALKYGIELSGDYPNLFNYIIYNSVYSRIENERLFKDIKKFEAALKEKLFVNDDQKALEKLSRHINILLGLVNIRLLNDDFDYYKAHQEEFAHEAFASFIDKMAAKFGFTFEVKNPSDAVRESMSKLEDFYRIAVKRDKALVDNTIQAMNKESAEISVLVTGGFHSEGIARLLEEQGVSYIVVCPNITKEVETPYIKILTNQRTPLEDILSDANTTAPDAKNTKSSMLAPYLVSCAAMDLSGLYGVKEISARTQDVLNAWAKDCIARWLPEARTALAKRMGKDPTQNMMVVQFSMDMEGAITAVEKQVGLEEAAALRKARAKIVKETAPAVIAGLMKKPEQDLRGPAAERGDKTVHKLIENRPFIGIDIEGGTIQDGKIVGGELRAYIIKYVDGYKPGLTDEQKYRGPPVDLTKLYSKKELANIKGWLASHLARTPQGAQKPITFRVALGLAALGWTDDEQHMNITHVGQADSAIYIGGLLFRHIFDEANLPLRNEILDNDEYQHLIGHHHGDDETYRARFELVVREMRGLEKMRVAMLHNNWRYLLAKLKTTLDTARKDPSALLKLLSICNEISASQPNHPVESRWPIMKVVTLLSREREARLVEALKKDPELRFSMAIADSILFMLRPDEIPDNWLSRWAPHLAGRNVWQASSEIWYAGGGLGRVMQFHGQGLQEIIRQCKKAGIKLRTIEPKYSYKPDPTDKTMQKWIPLDYSSGDSLSFPVTGDLTKPVDEFPVTYKRYDEKTGQRVMINTKAYIYKGTNKLGMDVYLIQEGNGEFITNGLYRYGTGNELPTWRQFTDFISAATFELVRRTEEKERAELQGEWKPPILHVNDAQFSLTALNRLRDDRTFTDMQGVTHQYSKDPLSQSITIVADTHTVPNREEGVGKEIRSKLDDADVPSNLWFHFKRAEDPADWDKLDFTSCLLRTSDWPLGVSKQFVEYVGPWDEWALARSGHSLKSVTNGDVRALTARVFRSKMQELFKDVNLEHPNPQQIIDTKAAIKREVKFATDRFESSNPDEDKNGLVLDPDKYVVSYAGRFVDEKAGLSRAFTEKNIRALLDMGAQVVIAGNIQNSSESREMARKLYKLIEDLKKEKHKGKLVFIPRFNLEEQRYILAASDFGVLDSNPRTEAAGFTEVDYAAVGAIVIAPPWQGGEGILVAQGLAIDLEEPGMGNTLIPRIDTQTPEAGYLEIYRNVIDRKKMPREDIAQYQATSVRLSRALSYIITSAEYFRQFDMAVEQKELASAANGAAVVSAQGAITATGQPLTDTQKAEVNEAIRNDFASGRAEKISVVDGVEIYEVPSLERFDYLIAHPGRGGEAMQHAKRRIYLSSSRALWYDNLPKNIKMEFLAHETDHLDNPYDDEDTVKSRAPIDNIIRYVQEQEVSSEVSTAVKVAVTAPVINEAPTAVKVAVPAPAMNNIDVDIVTAARALGIDEEIVRGAILGSVNKTVLLNNFAKTVGIPAQDVIKGQVVVRKGAITLMVESGLAVLNPADKSGYNLTPDFFSTTKLGGIRNSLIAANTSPKTVHLPPVTINRIILNSINVNKFITLLLPTGQNINRSIETLKRYSVFPTLVTTWCLANPAALNPGLGANATAPFRAGESAPTVTAAIAPAMNNIDVDVVAVAKVLGINGEVVHAAVVGSMNKTVLLNDFAESVGIPAKDVIKGQVVVRKGAITLMVESGLAVLSQTEKAGYNLTQDFFNPAKLDDFRNRLIAASDNPKMVNLSPVRIQRIILNSMDVNKFIALLSAGKNVNTSVNKLKNACVFPTLIATWYLSNPAALNPNLKANATVPLEVSSMVSPSSGSIYSANGVNVSFSLPSNTNVSAQQLAALQEYQNTVVNLDMARGGYNYRGVGTNQTVQQFFSEHFAKEWYGKIIDFKRAQFSESEPLEAIVTNGIGANDQFMWSLVNMYNSNRPAGAPAWYHVTTAREFAALYAAGKIKPKNTLFIDISRSGSTWEGVEVGIRSLSLGFNKRIAVANGSALAEIAKSAAKSGNYTPLIIGISPDIGGRNMHRKTSIYYTVQAIAGLYVPEMKPENFAKLNDKFDQANAFSNPETNLAVGTGKFLHGAMRLLGVEHIAMLTNTESLRLVATEWEQYIMEGSNKEDVISLGIHDMSKEPPEVLTSLANSPAGKRVIGIAILDINSHNYKSELERVNALKETMPLVVFTINSQESELRGGISPNQQAAFDILWTDLVTVFTTLLRVDANSNPNVKIVRQYTKDRVAGWKASEENYAKSPLNTGEAELVVSYGNPNAPKLGTEGNQQPITMANAAQRGREIAASLAKEGLLAGRSRLNLFVGREDLKPIVDTMRTQAYLSALGSKFGWITQTAVFPIWSHKGLEANLAYSTNPNRPLLANETVNIFFNARALGREEIYNQPFNSLGIMGSEFEGINGANIHQTNEAMTLPNIKRMAEVSPTILLEFNEKTENVEAMLKEFYKGLIEELGRRAPSDTFDHTIESIMQSSNTGERARKIAQVLFAKEAAPVKGQPTADMVKKHLIFVKNAIPDEQLKTTTAINFASICASYYNQMEGYTADIVDDYDGAVKLLAKNPTWDKTNTIVGLINIESLDGMSAALKSSDMEDKTRLLPMEQFDKNQYVPLKGFFDLMSILVQVNRPLDKPEDQELKDAIKDLLDEIGVRDADNMVRALSEDNPMNALSVKAYFEDPVRFIKNFIVRLLPPTKPASPTELRDRYNAAKKVVESL